MSQQQQQQPPMWTEQHGNQVIHVRGDSDSNMEELFSVLHHQKSSSGSLKHRKLPASFFSPPEPRFPAGYQLPCCSHGVVPNAAGGFSVINGCGVHGRSVSSPAQLAHGSMQKGASASNPPPQQQHQQHTKQGSLDCEMRDEYCSNNWDKCPRYYLK